MSHPDLPEPQAVSLTLEEKNQRHWRLISTFIGFVAGYSVLHKLLIPFFLKFTQVTKTPYSEIDPYFIHAILLAYLIQKEKKNTKAISLLCGFGVLYGVSEIGHAFQGLYEGWLAVSRLLSAVPLAIASGYLMSQPSSGKSFSWAWLGALLGIVSFFGPMVKSNKASWVSDRSQVTQPTEKRGLIPVNQDCGNSELNLDLKQDHSTSSQIVLDPSCGFKPAIVRLKDDNLAIINQTDRPINVHLMVFERGKASSRWNMMVPPKTQLKTPNLPRNGLEVGFLYSDNTPLMGIVGLVFSPDKLDKRFRASRSPLRIEEVQ